MKKKPMKKRKLLLLCLLCLGGAAGAVVAQQNSGLGDPRAANADFRKGVAEAKADFANGRTGWYFHSYSNMPNGPDDPILARQRDLFTAALKAKGIEPMNSNSGCIPVPGLPDLADGYNSIADAKLKAKFGDNYMTLLKEEVALRMRESPQAAK